ncbi:replicative helicase loader/inhibitor [Bacillus litorisediminis]|uniref:replicative helicase loader/inhibitor n=1 Tax=Bacillus litorisediminis TaxID=2922713 RepID=UPI001FAB378C|nr:replicative helicase loader/inhibitor [Bacillus litorisediminis]
MTREQVKEVFKVINAAYSQFEVTKEKLDIWHKYLMDQNPATVMMKVERFILESKFPPTIAELRDNRIQQEDPSVLAVFWSAEQ